MGFLTPQGEDDEQQGEIVIAGMERLDGGRGGDEITYELDEWSEPDREVLADRLVRLGAPHTWEGATLVIDGADEAWVERIMDQVEDDLSTATVEDDEQVLYDLTDWDDTTCIALLDALTDEAIPYDLDGDEVLVASIDEPRVDEIVASLTTPGVTLAAGGPASFEAMSELFVAADQLSHDALDKSATAALVQGARAAAGAAAPYGMEAGWWDGVVAQAGALADLVESPSPEAEHIEQLAGALRNELRPFI